MALTKYKLGDLIEPRDVRNFDNLLTLDNLKGISTNKEFIETKADMDGVSLSSYKVVNEGEFAYVADTSRRGEKIALAFNKSKRAYLISSIYTVFRVSRKELILPDYLFIYFNRPEFDRYSRFNSWGSARETFSWEDMCDIDIELPDLPTQQKFVDVYKGMVANQQAYEKGLEDLKLVCDGYIEDLRRKIPCEKIGGYIEELSIKNDDGKYTIENVRGVSINKEFIFSKADLEGVSAEGYKIVENNQFAFNPNTARMGDKICVALNKSGETRLVSAIYPVFKVVNEGKLLSAYLMMWIKRKEFDRYSRYNSWGSARETFNYCDMEEVEIPIPDIRVQKAIVDVYNVYIERKEINEKLKAQIKDLCPILIKGSLEEGK